MARYRKKMNKRANKRNFRSKSRVNKRNVRSVMRGGIRM